MKKKLKYFVSYAHKTDRQAKLLLEIFEEHASLSRNYIYEKWIDDDIILGEDWNQQIQEAIAECDFGLLLLSATYFTRRYIREDELAHFIKPKGEILAPMVPVGLETFDLGGDLLGLEKTQIFRYKNKPGADPKFFDQLVRKNQRIKFVQALLKDMKRKFDKYYPATTS